MAVDTVESGLEAACDDVRRLVSGKFPILKEDGISLW